MMKLPKRFVAASAAALLLVASGCDEGLTDVNINPNDPEEVPPPFILAAGIFNAVGDSYGLGGYWTMMYHGTLWAQHVAQPIYNDEDKYTPRAGVNTNIWDVIYQRGLKPLDEVKRLADLEGDNNLWAVAEIMTVYAFLGLTDLWGAIPYTEALSLDEGIQSPAYDSPQTIYPDLMRRLREAAARINPSAPVTFTNGDLIYDGNMGRWVRFAHSLRLRIASRLAYTNLASTGSTEFADAWSKGVFTSNADNADLDWPGVQGQGQNPIYENFVLGARSGDFRISQALVDTLRNRNDPRLAIYAELAADGVYRGLPNGMLPTQLTVAGRTGTLTDFSAVGSYFVSPTTPSMLMSYAEVLFLAAEAAERGWIAGGAAQAANYYRSAIEASMRDLGISQAAINAYIAQLSVAYSGDQTTRLNRIFLQKWIALFLQGPEAYNEFRRTLVPHFQLAANPTQADFPQRLLYPPEEALYNPANNPKDVTLTTPLFWSFRGR